MRAQMKMAETIIVMIIFFILLAFGMIFYAKFQGSMNKDKGKEKFQLAAVQIAQRVESLPELQCTIEGSSDYDCIDMYKLQAFALTKDQNIGVYEKIMPNTRISAISSYPIKDRWLIYDSVQRNQTALVPFSLPVAIFDPINETHNFGMLVIEVYQ